MKWVGGERGTYQICCNDESTEILNHVPTYGRWPRRWSGEAGRANQASEICVKQECEFFISPRQPGRGAVEIANDYIGA